MRTPNKAQNLLIEVEEVCKDVSLEASRITLFWIYFALNIISTNLQILKTTTPPKIRQGGIVHKKDISSNIVNLPDGQRIFQNDLALKEAIKTGLVGEPIKIELRL